VAKLETEILEILKSMQSDIKAMKNDIDGIKSAQMEHTQILRALEHKTDVIAAEQENLKHEVAELKGEVKGMREDLDSVELITAGNLSDIAKLKAVK
jgi:predicted  nucleic acid-binding Zn-ribbon protein